LSSDNSDFNAWSLASAPDAEKSLNRRPSPERLSDTFQISKRLSCVIDRLDEADYPVRIPAMSHAMGAARWLTA
jgi:hypothetical protein